MQEKRPISMQQIAEALGVSRATVSNALRGTGRLSEDVAARIRAAAEEMGYVPSHAGLSLRTGRSMTIGLLVPDFSMPLFAAFAQAFERAAKARGLALMVAESMGAPMIQAEEIRNLVARGVDALVVIPLRGSQLDEVTLPVPLLVVDSSANPRNTASGDHRDGGRQIARHLAGLGHQSVLIVESATASNVSDERVAGMAEIFSARGITVRSAAIPPTFDAARAYGMTLDLLVGEVPATAMACAYDAQAVGLISALTARGLSLPQDMSITGFDDVIWGRIVSPPLTTVRQDLAAIAEHALAVAARESKHPRTFPVSLVIRGSTAAPRSMSLSPAALQQDAQK
jgi:LacI family transcriptional regulator